MLSWASETVPPQRPDETGTTVEAHQFGYTAVVPAVPLPPVNTPGPPREAYPLQSELSQNHRVLHTHIFKEVIPPPQSGLGSRLMVMEVDQYGVERHRQAEFFFNGIVGHVRSYDGGHIYSWSLQATRLGNYWRRHYNIPEVHDENTSWTSSWQDRHRPSDNVDNTAGTYGEQHESEMEDDTSVTVETGNVSIPSQIHQLASLLHKFSYLTGNIMQRSLRSSKLLPQIQMPILSSCSRQSIWPILPATCQSLRRLSPNVLRIMNWTTSRRSPTR